MARGAASTPQKGKARLVSSVGDAWLALAYVADGVVSASGVSVMVLQGKEVAIPGAMALLLFQLCYILPQLVTTPLTEYLCSRVSARKVLLPLTTLASLVSSYAVLQSLSRRSLALFYIARVVGGFLRHPKILFAAAQLETGGAAAADRPAGDINTLALPAMHTGFVVSALLGDLWKEAAAVQRHFVYVETAVLAVVCAMALTTPRRPKRDQARRERQLSAATLSRHTLRVMLTTLPDTGTLAAWGFVITFAALRVGAGVNQCMYPLIGPGAFGMPYIFTGFYLVLQDKLMLWIAAPLMRWRRGVVAPVSALLSIAGAWVAPVAVSYGPLVYFPATFVLVDVPTAVLHLGLVGSVPQLPACPDGIKQGLSGGFLVYVLVAAKLLSAPLRLACVAALPEWKHASRAIAVPATLHVAVTHLTNKPFLGLAAACACAAVLLNTGAQSGVLAHSDL